MIKIAFGVVLGVILSFSVFYGGTKMVAQQNRFQFQGSYWSTDFGVGGKDHPYQIIAVCDSANGIIVYSMGRSYQYGAMSTQSNGCAKRQ